MESCDIYLKSVVYRELSWLDSPDALLDLIYNNLNEISAFDFVSISINMAQVYNVNLKTSNYDSALIYLKGVKFKQEEFLTEGDLQELEVEIRKQLGYIEGLYVGEIEVRSSKLYTNYDLGLVELPEPPKKLPYVVERL